LAEVADAGRPVNVGRWALTGAQRRRRRAAVAAVAVTVLAVAAPIGVLRLTRNTDAAPPPGGGMAGKVVVTSYVDTDGVEKVLDPQTGEYRHRLDYGQNPIVSPDLRTVASATSTSVTLASTTTNDVRRVAIPGGRMILRVAWSPESRLLSIVDIPTPDLSRSGSGRPLDIGITTLTMIDAATGQSHRMSLAFPPGRTGCESIGVFWPDARHIVVPSMTLDAARSVDGNNAPIVDRLSVFDLDGHLTADLPLHQEGAPDAARLWTPVGGAGAGHALLRREPRPGTVEIAVLDLAADTGPHRAVTYTPPPAPTGRSWLSTFPVWLPGNRVLLVSVLTPRGVPCERLPETLATLDLGTGQVRPVDLPLVPVGASGITLGPADRLGPDLANLSF
jgi:hypothetical protein